MKPSWTWTHWIATFFSNFLYIEKDEKLKFWERKRKEKKRKEKDKVEKTSEKAEEEEEPMIYCHSWYLILLQRNLSECLCWIEQAPNKKIPIWIACFIIITFWVIEANKNRAKTRVGGEWRREWDQMGILYDYEDVVLIRQAEKPGDPAEITVNCPDKTGLGCDLCRIILQFGLSITRGGQFLSFGTYFTFSSFVAGKWRRERGERGGKHHGSFFFFLIFFG